MTFCVLVLRVQVVVAVVVVVVVVVRKVRMAVLLKCL